MIPRSFSLAGHTVNVEVVPEKHWSDDETVGFFNSQNMTISVLEGIGPQRTQQIFCHEVVHAILHTMAEEKLCDNEKFVDLFGSLLHQVWTTIEGKTPAAPARNGGAVSAKRGGKRRVTKSKAGAKKASRNT